MTLAFLFPGQGSQSIGMLSALAADSPEVQETFAAASRVLGRDLWAVAQQGPDGVLNQTETTQPVMLAAGVACWRVWERLGGARPAFMAGHSLGEYSALVCAGALDFEAAVGLVAERARLMQNAVPAGAGAMAAILGLDDALVAEVCAKAAAGEIVEPVNYNSPGQIVIAGDTAAVERASALAKNAGAKRVVMLPVSVPSHCSLMKDAADRLGRVLESVEIRVPPIPVIHNAHVRAETDSRGIRQALAAQICSPVRWTDTVRWLAAAGATHMGECGPGKVLAGLNKRIDPSVETHVLYEPAGIKAAALGLISGGQAWGR